MTENSLFWITSGHLNTVPCWSLVCGMIIWTTITRSSRVKTIEESLDAVGSEAYRIMADGEKVGGVILNIDEATGHNHLEILFVSPKAHSQGVGYGAWLAVEALHPETKFGKPIRHILIKGTSIFMLINAASILWSFIPNTISTPRFRWMETMMRGRMKCSGS